MNALKSTTGQFIGGAFALIALFLVLAHFTGFTHDVSSLSSGAGHIFSILQGK